MTKKIWKNNLDKFEWRIKQRLDDLDLQMLKLTNIIHKQKLTNI